MTHRAAGLSRGVPRIWLLPLLVLTVILGLTAAEIFSRSLILDLVAWWPAWALLLVIVAFAGRRRIGRLRVDGLASIMVTAALVVFTVGHAQGWPINPSASHYLVGPAAADFEEAELIAEPDGDLRLGAGSRFLYEVDLLSGGGDVGVPSAIERTFGQSTSVSLVPAPNPGFARASGWDIRLSAEPVWALVLGGDVEADVSALRVDELDLSGAGSVRLGAVGRMTLVDVEGAFMFSVPAGSPVRVIGTAQVPGSWVQTSDGWMSSVEGQGWVISVPSGSVVSIEER